MSAIKHQILPQKAREQIIDDLLQTTEVLLVMVTPDLARDMLTKNKKNRRLNVLHMKRLSHDMSAGRWVFTGLPIVFDRDDVLVNGQHTLTAIVDSGTAQPCLIVRGVDPKALFAFDDGKKRSFSDLCVIMGREHVACIQSITRWVLKYEGGILGSTANQAFSIGEQEECLSRNPDIEDAARFVGCNKSLRGIIQPSVAGFVRWYTARTDLDLSDQFFAHLATGVGLDAGNPVLLLREGLLNFRVSPKAKGMDARYILAITIKAWNHFKRGTKLKTLRWRTEGSNPENFPTFE